MTFQVAEPQVRRRSRQEAAGRAVASVWLGEGGGERQGAVREVRRNDHRASGCAPVGALLRITGHWGGLGRGVTPSDFHCQLHSGLLQRFLAQARLRDKCGKGAGHGRRAGRGGEGSPSQSCSLSPEGGHLEEGTAWAKA